MCQGCEPTPKLELPSRTRAARTCGQLDEQIYDKASRGKHEAAIRDVTERLIMLEEEELDSPAAVARVRPDARRRPPPTQSIKKRRRGGSSARARVEKPVAAESSSSRARKRLAKLGVLAVLGVAPRQISRVADPGTTRHGRVKMDLFAPPPIVNGGKRHHI